MKTKKYIQYNGKGEHSVNELREIINMREEEFNLITVNTKYATITPPQFDLIKNKSIIELEKAIEQYEEILHIIRSDNTNS